MPNMYFFWKLVADPPAPFQRLTRTNQYLRFNATPGNHWSEVGAVTHTHSSISSWSCGNGTVVLLNKAGIGQLAMAPHQHPAPSWAIGNNNNNPPGYGLDIVYVDLDKWEATLRYFPAGAVLLSNGELIDAELSRFSAADGKYIVHAEPGTTVGSDTPQGHTVSGTTGSGGSSGLGTYFSSGSSAPSPGSHGHGVNLTSESKYVEPVNLVTRLYEASATTSKALAGVVVFLDGTPGDNWEILTAWAGGNLKSGNSNPTLSGSDSHTQSLSGNTANASLGGSAGSGSDSSASTTTHNHAISGTLNSASHIPSSRLIVPARLLNTLLASKPTNRVQIIGL